MRCAGDVVHTASLTADGAGTYRINLASKSSILRLLLVLSFVRLDQVRMHYVDSFLPTGRGRLNVFGIQFMQCALWTYLSLRAPFTLVVHEFSPAVEFSDRVFWSRRRLFGAAKSIEFHTAIERLNFEKAVPRTTKKNCIVPHKRHFMKAFDGTQAEARLKLGIATEQRIFLCLGFIQRHKAFDLAIRSFAGARPHNSELYVVGSIRDDTKENSDYRDELAELIAGTPNASMVESFVTDEIFDMWICAADMVLLPYEEIWTSGVLARAMLYRRPVAMRDHPTLREQAREYAAEFFRGERELGEILCRAAKTNNDIVIRAAYKQDVRPRVLIVAPLYGPMHTGGAERVISDFASLLTSSCDVEIWSTRSSRLEGRDNNLTDHPVGQTQRVRRFGTNVLVEGIFRLSHRRVANARRGSIWQWLWARSSICGVGMVRALHREHAHFDVVLLPHYFYGSTHRLASVAPEKTILHPFLHDEPALRTRVIARLLGAPCLVTFNSEAERLIARKQLSLPVFRSHVVGNVVSGPPIDLQTSGAREAPPTPFHYLLYVGRVIEEKNVCLLGRWFQDARAVLPDGMRLIIVGEGPATSSELEHPSIIRLTRVTEREKWSLMANCVALVQLSVLESFSLVTAEAWLAGRPVIVHADCAATTLHVSACKGGKIVRDSTDFTAAVLDLTRDPIMAQQMAVRGKRYVRSNFSSEIIRGRLKQAIEIVMGGTATLTLPSSTPPRLPSSPGAIRVGRHWATDRKRSLKGRLS
jgi:glycosyltransferase involved in cell wall biosynthesis